MIWRTTVEYVDRETGEILTSGEVRENYVIINTKTKYEINGNKGQRNIRKECERSRQTKLFG